MLSVLEFVNIHVMSEASSLESYRVMLGGVAISILGPCLPTVTKTAVQWAACLRRDLSGKWSRVTEWL